MAKRSRSAWTPVRVVGCVDTLAAIKGGPA